MRDAVRITVIATGIQSKRAENKLTDDASLKEVVTKLTSAVEEMSDEFEIPAFIRRRSVREGK